MTGSRMRCRGMVRLVAGLLAGWPSLAKPGGVRRRVPAGAVALVLGLALAGAPAAGQAAAGGAASLEVKGELAGSVLYRQQPAGGSRTLGVLSGRLDLGLRPVKGSDWWVAAAVEPWLPVGMGGHGPVPQGSVAVTEAYAGFRFGAIDVYLGRFPLPLETARLALPYTLTPPDEAGRRPGVDGLRADIYLPAGRLQLAAVQARDVPEGAPARAWMPVLGWRQELPGWEATGFVLGQERGLGGGVAASGLAGSTIVYGEAWMLADEQRPRYSLGATGFVGDGLWTAELARAGLLPAAAAGVPASPVPLAALQLTYPVAPGWSLEVDGRVALEGAPPERAHLVRVAITYDLVPGQAELEVSARRWALPPLPAAYDAGAALRWYF